MPHTPKVKMGGYRTTESYHAKTEAAREKQLSGLRAGWGMKGKRKALEGGDATPDLDSASYRDNIVAFAEQQFFVSRHWQDGQWVLKRAPIVLLPWQRDWLRELLHSGASYTLAMLGAVKKSGKSCLSSLLAAYHLFCGEDEEQIFIASADLDAASWVVFDRLCRAIRCNPEMFSRVDIQRDSVRNRRTDTVVRAIPMSATIAGVEPSLVLFDELHLFIYEGHKRFFDELTTIPTRRMLTVCTSYAGVQGEESVLLDLYNRGIAGDDPNYLFRWHTDPHLCPWLTPEYLESQRKRLRPSTFSRLHLNLWSAAEENFISGEVYDSCVDPMLLRGTAAPGGVFLGIDAATKSDCAAVVACTVEGEETVRLVDYSVFQPLAGQPLDLEQTLEAAVLELSKRHNILSAYYDPFQFQRSAMTLRNKGVPMVEYPQTVGNLCQMCESLGGIFKAKKLRLYPSEELRRHVLNAAVVEHAERGWRLTKRKATQKIDLCVSLAMAVPGAIKMAVRPSITVLDGNRVQTRVEETEQERFERLLNTDSVWQRW
jgi:hypothetical protein